MKDSMKDRIVSAVVDFVDEYQRRPYIMTSFGKPLVGFADALSSYVQNLPSVVSPGHVLPQLIMKDASVIISYYVPFTRELAEGNNAAQTWDNTVTRSDKCTDPVCTGGAGYNGVADSDRAAGFSGAADSDRAAGFSGAADSDRAAGFSGAASPGWARAYEEANSMFIQLNSHIISVIEGMGFNGSVPQAATFFHRSTLKSDWSQRHIAYAAGLGTFGINNMLITPVGCCGRFNSIITSIPRSILTPTGPLAEELCLYKRNGSCGVCIKNCPSGALHAPDDDGSVSYSAKACYELCLKNAAIYPAGCFTDQASCESVSSPYAMSNASCAGSCASCAGSNASYAGPAASCAGPAASCTDHASSYAGSAGSEVCGKCVTGAACAFRGF